MSRTKKVIKDLVGGQPRSRFLPWEPKEFDDDLPAQPEPDQGVDFGAWIDSIAAEQNVGNAKRVYDVLCRMTREAFDANNPAILPSVNQIASEIGAAYSTVGHILINLARQGRAVKIGTGNNIRWAARNG